ncbi:MAG: beta-propeller fold lactonase family protein, partial [Candidatus Sulfotelmatobacter sp.]
CTSAMLSACGTSTNVQLDPSGNYLFLTDPASQQVRVGSIDLPENAVTDTGNFLPFTSQTPGFAFSPDGALVYALLASDLNLHVYRFDPTSGNLTEGEASIPVPNSAGFAPALRQ